MLRELLLLLVLLVKTCQSLDKTDTWIKDPSDPTDLLNTEPELNFSDDTILDTYEKAVQAYLLEDWRDCIHIFHRLIYKYKKYRQAVIDCRMKCYDEMKRFDPIFRENIEDLHFYEKKVKETLCLLTCNQEYRALVGKQAHKRLPLKDEWKLITAEHYNYLHHCYYQEKYYQEAANAAFTYLVHHLDHKVSRLSFAYYTSLPGVNSSLISNLEAELFIKYYKKGVKAYEQEHFSEAVENFEQSLDLYFKSEQECRFYCEGPFEQDWNPEFTTALANHFVYNLRCKRRCSRILNIIDGEYRRDLVPQHLNYLQFSYYKLDQLEEACKAAQSYLLFHPTDEIMLSNKLYYTSIATVNQDFFIPRQDCLQYVQRQEYEKRLLLYIQDEFEAFEKKIMNEET